MPHTFRSPEAEQRFREQASIDELIEQYGSDGLILCERRLPVTSPRRAAAAPAQGDPFAPMANGSDEFVFSVAGATVGGSGFPVGVWPAKVDNVEFGLSQSSGKPMLTWYLSGVGGRARGRSGRYYTTINNEETHKNFSAKGIIQALELGDGSDNIRFSKTEAVGRLCAVVVEEDEGRDGVVRPTIKDVLHWSSFGDEVDFVEAAERLGLQTDDGAPR